MKPFLLSLFLCVVFAARVLGASEFALHLGKRQPQTQKARQPRQSNMASYGSNNKGYGSHSKASYGSKDKGYGSHSKASYGSKDKGYGSHSKSPVIIIKSKTQQHQSTASYGSSNKGYGSHSKASYGSKDKGYGSHSKASYGSSNKGYGSHSKGYGSSYKTNYGYKPRSKKLTCHSFSCGPTANQIPNAKKVKCSKQGCTFNRCCEVLCTPTYDEECTAIVYDNPLTRGLCYDYTYESDEEFCKIRPVAHIKSYIIANNCGDDIVLTGQSVDVEKYSCNAQVGCHLVIPNRTTVVFDRTQNTDFFPIGDSLGGGQRLQFAYDADCAEEVNKVWLELNQSPARCPIPGVDLPNGQNEAGNSINDFSGMEQCSDPDAYLEFGDFYTCFDDSQVPPSLINCNDPRATRHHAPGTPHVNFARQAGFTNLNLQVSFENDQGDPYCSGGVTRGNSPFSRAQTQMSTHWCDENKPTSQESAQKEQVCSGNVQVCRPFCPKNGFKRSLREWSKTIDTNCNACTLENEVVDQALNHYEPIELNYYAEYLSSSSCVWDVPAKRWLQQPPTVTTQMDYDANRVGARKFNKNVFPPQGEATSSGASMFECWDKAGTGAQGIGWGESCDVSQFTRMVVTLCPEPVTCFDPTE